MRTQIVYTLIDSGNGIYALQAWVSILSLKHHNPDAVAVVVCDRETSEYVHKLPVRSLINEIVAVDFPAEKSAMERSRLLKTNLRNLVSGDFLYVDTDTIITASLQEIDNVQDSICAVRDSHCGNIGNPYIEMNRKNAAKLGYSLDSETQFFNGGVVYAKDDSAAVAFYNQWNSYYQEGITLGINIDQTSFAKSNIKLGYIMKELPDEWNCQLRHGARFLKDARIVHYLWTAKRTQSPFLLGRQEIWDEIRSTGKVPEKVIELFDDPFKGIQDFTYLASSEETAFLSGRIYKVAYKFEKESKTFNRMLKFCVRALDAIYKMISRCKQYS